MDSLTLGLINWRLFQNKVVTFEQKNTLLYGDNGVGKTTILAALYALYTGKAWPGTTWRQQITTGEQYFGITLPNNPDWYLSGLISPQGRVITRYEYEPPLDWKRSALSYIPDDNRWLQLSRVNRLDIIDQSLSAVYGSPYQEALKKLLKAVQSKASVIRQHQETGSSDMILVDELHDMIGEQSEVLWKYRREFFISFQESLKEFAQWIDSPLTKSVLKYSASFGSIRQDALQKLTWIDSSSAYAKEAQAGRPLFGAQRDDMMIELNDQPAEVFLSRGENRALTIFFKKFVRSRLNTPVVWFLDDFFNEFDQHREKAVLQTMVDQHDWIVATATRKVEGFENYITLD